MSKRPLLSWAQFKRLHSLRGLPGLEPTTPSAHRFLWGRETWRDSGAALMPSSGAEGPLQKCTGHPKRAPSTPSRLRVGGHVAWRAVTFAGPSPSWRLTRAPHLGEREPHHSRGTPPTGEWEGGQWNRYREQPVVHGKAVVAGVPAFPESPWHLWVAETPARRHREATE